ncbi:unnamed protein product [marine sediment metagenome]|uniref:Glycosyltransferase family 28 N-terminal domain-containing protein n=1 Tax=marine sediment metagenome TaxID=412755 RepID=X1HWR4_9ZZZZ
MKICLICPPGGHLDQLMSIKDAFKDQDIFFVTYSSETSGKLIDIRKIYYVKNPPKPNLLSVYIFYLIVYCIYLTLPFIKILYEEKPDVIIGCGGSVTLIMSYLGKLIGIKVIYLGSLTRVHNLSISDKLVLNISDLFLVQWKGLADRYKKTKYWGKVI